MPSVPYLSRLMRAKNADFLLDVLDLKLYMEVIYVISYPAWIEHKRAHFGLISHVIILLDFA